MTRITYKGYVWLKINKEDWEFEGGETNPDLLRLPCKKGRGNNHFKLRDGVYVGTKEKSE